jgi:hypothetical protein
MAGYAQHARGGNRGADEGCEAGAGRQRIVEPDNARPEPALPRRAPAASQRERLEPRHAALQVRAGQHAVGADGIATRAQHPQRTHQLEAGRARHPHALAATPAVERAPAVRVRDVVEIAVAAPFRLERGAAGAAGNAPWLLQRAIFPDRGEMQCGAIPGHVGQIPGEVCQVHAVGREAGTCVEVVPAGELGDAPICKRHGHQQVARPAARRMDLGGADQAPARRVERKIGKAGVGRVADATRGAFLEAVDLLVAIVDEENAAAGDEELSPAVFVEPRAGREGRRQEVGEAAVGTGAHNDLPPPFLGAGLAPIDQARLRLQGTEAAACRGDRRGADRRGPGSIG